MISMMGQRKVLQPNKTISKLWRVMVCCKLIQREMTNFFEEFSNYYNHVLMCALFIYHSFSNFGMQTIQIWFIPVNCELKSNCSKRNSFLSPFSINTRQYLIHVKDVWNPSTSSCTQYHNVFLTLWTLIWALAYIFFSLQESIDMVSSGGV